MNGGTRLTRAVGASRPLAARLTDALALLDRLQATMASAQHRKNLDWLGDSFRLALLLFEAR